MTSSAPTAVSVTRGRECRRSLLPFCGHDNAGAEPAGGGGSVRGSAVSEGSTGVQAGVAVLVLLPAVTIEGFKLGHAYHATFGVSVLYSLGLLVLLPLALVVVALPVMLIVLGLKRHRISAARSRSADRLVTWLGLAGVDELTDEDALAWSKAAGRVSVAEAQRWSDYGLPFTMIPLARQMGVRLPQVADVVALLREAGIDPGPRRRLDSVLYNNDPIDGRFYLHWQLFTAAEIRQALAGKVAEAAMRGIYSPYGPMTEAYVELAC